MPVIGPVLRLGTKFGILGGAFYYTTQAGLWGSCAETEELYREMYKTAAPYTKQGPMLEFPDLPRVSDATRAITNTWNGGVITSTNFLMHLPTHVTNWTTAAYNKVNELVSDPNPPSA
uniref:MICOS complex subunit MIC13 n=1 Tax=Graphocephala atropunctata TaxID=36148 RepID=A0A1B6LTK8_9HEMI